MTLEGYVSNLRLYLSDLVNDGLPPAVLSTLKECVEPERVKHGLNLLLAGRELDEKSRPGLSAAIVAILSVANYVRVPDDDLNARQGFWNGSRPPFGYGLAVQERRGTRDKKVLIVREDETQIIRLPQTGCTPDRQCSDAPRWRCAMRPLRRGADQEYRQKWRLSLLLLFRPAQERRNSLPRPAYPYGSSRSDRHRRADLPHPAA